MTCPNCNAENEPGRKFCGECGTRLAQACPNCGTPNPPSSRFCGECGTALAGGGPRATTPPTSAPSGGPAASSLVPGAVAERRLVSVLFADLVGFTTLAEGRDHEEVRELLSRYFDIAREVVGRYGGTVEKFIGDAVMAVWGAPTAHEDDAERAVRAALDLVEAVPALGRGVQARAGVLTGEAAVTLGATNQGMVAGDLVNTASRLQSVAPPGAVLVGEPTQRAASRAIAFERVDDQALKGKAAPVPAWRAVRVVAERGGRGRGDRLEAPFVARDAELRLLKDLFHATSREQRVRLVSITGQAGIGKSRLAWEFLKYADGVVEQIWWHEGRSPAYGEGITFWALGEMVRSRAGLLETDDEGQTRTKVSAKVREFVQDEAERQRVERALFALLGVGEAPAGGAGELFGAWRIFFERMAATGTVAMLFEDLHWADPGLLDFIDHVLEWSRNVPILIVTLARPELLERRPDWGAGRRNFLALDLQPLDEAAMRELLDGLVPDLPEPAIQSIVIRAEGIPLYAVETIRMLAADGRLVERPEGGFRTEGALGELSVPESLHALIAARLDGLGPAERALVADAAVLGQSFTEAGLAAVSGLAIEALQAGLHSLERADLLRRDVDPRSPELGQYAFVQGLIREVAYATVSMRDRRTRHLAAARFFEGLGDDELAGALAAHYLAAFRASGDGPEAEAVATQARIALRSAADRAGALGATRQALTFLRQALEVATTPADRADILEQAAEAASAAAEYDQAIGLAQELEAVSRDLGDRPRAARSVAIRAEALYRARQRDQATAMTAAAIEEFADLGDDPALLRLIGDHAVSAVFTREYETAAAYADRALAAAERLNEAGVAARMLMVKGQLAMFHGRMWEAMALTDGARKLAEQRGLADETLRIKTALTNITALDDPRATVEVERQIVEGARRLGRRELEIVTLGNMAEDVRRTGDWDWMIRELESVIESESTVHDLIVDAALSEFRLNRGELAEADEATLAARVRELQDPDVVSHLHDLEATRAALEDDYAAAADGWFAQAARSPLNAPYALPKAGLAAIMAADPVRARAALDRLTELGARGRALENDIALVQAGLAGLAGQHSAAIVGFRTVRATYEELGLAWDVAMTGLAAGRILGGAEPEVRDWLASARDTYARLRVHALVERTDALLAASDSTVRSGEAAARAEAAPDPTAAVEAPTA